MFVRWIIGDMGVEGSYEYQAMHLITVAIVLAVLISFIFIAKTKKISYENKNKILKGIAIFQLSFEILWRVLYLIFNDLNANEYWPMYPCNLGGVLLPIICLIDNKTMKKMFYLFGFVGACITFAYPNGIYSNNIFVFPILKSILQHTGLLLIPAFEFFMKKYRSSLYDYIYLVLGCIVHVINAEVIDKVIGLEGDYIYFNSGLPFTIPNVPGCITLSVFALIVFFGLSYLCDIKKSNECLKKIFSKKENVNE